jgi:hypothetical protein
MSIASNPVADGAIGYLPSRKMKANQPPVRRQYVVSAHPNVVPEAR